jgi:hypothetical protein
MGNLSYDLVDIAGGELLELYLAYPGDQVLAHERRVLLMRGPGDGAFQGAGHPALPIRGHRLARARVQTLLPFATGLAELLRHFSFAVGVEAAWLLTGGNDLWRFSALVTPIGAKPDCSLAFGASAIGHGHLLVYP